MKHGLAECRSRNDSGIQDSILRFRGHDAVAVFFCRGTDGKLPADGIDENLNVIVLSELTNTGCAELHELVVDDGMGISRIVEELTSGNLKATQVKITGLHFKANLLLGVGFFFGRGIHALGSLVIIAFLETGPPWIDGDEALQNTIFHHTDLRQNGFVSILGVIEHTLDGNEIVPGHNTLVMVAITALRTLTSILFGFVIAIVWRKGLSGQHIPAMALIAKDLHDSRGSPVDIPQIGLAAQGVERIRNLLRGVSIQIHKKCQFHGWRLVGIWNKAAIGIVSIAEQLGSQRYTIVQPHP